ncbi:MAG: hypothetical protein SPF22_09000 [Candidatus Onthovivens sp.]|nr:hypothetical protein [Candidatus Onthovivens sp.]
MKTSKKEIKNTEDKFSKEQIVKSKRFRNNIDLLNAILKENKQYTLKEVEEIIKNFMKGKV